jgi:hypothetical protein
MHDRKRLAKVVGLPVLALCGFVTAAVFAGAGLGGPTDTTTTTTAPPSTTTPGFWKNAPKTHPLAYGTTGLTPTSTLASVGFNVDASLTFQDALSTSGGGVEALLRQAAAAYLNAVSSAVDYAFTGAQVVSMTNAALANPALVESTKDTLETQNSFETPGFCD